MVKSDCLAVSDWLHPLWICQIGYQPAHLQKQLYVCTINQYMLTVIETPIFQEYARSVWKDAEREAFIDWIAVNADMGDVIPGAGSLRKVRWAREGMGKRGGARVIYFNRLANGEVVLLLVYAKAKLDNLRPEFLVKLKEGFHG